MRDLKNELHLSYSATDAYLSRTHGFGQTLGRIKENWGISESPYFALPPFFKLSMLIVKCSLQAVRFLMDSSVIQLYPTLFVLATDIMDMLGELVWNRIHQKAGITEGVGSIPKAVENVSVSFGIMMHRLTSSFLSPPLMSLYVFLFTKFP